MKAPGIQNDAQGNELNLAWVTAAQRKDLMAFNRLVIDYQDQIYNFAYYVLCDPAAAAQATQLTFARAFQRISKYRNGPFLLWLMQNLIENCRDMLKQKQALSIDSNPVLPLAALAPELRLAVALVDIEGLDHLQAAQITGKSPHQFLQCVAQARQQLCSSAYP